MNFTIAQSALYRAANRVRLASNGRSFLPSAGHILLTAKNSQLRLTCCDLDRQISECVPTDVEQSGEVSVNTAQLFSIVQKLEYPELRFKLADNSLQIASGEASASLRVMSEQFTELTMPATPQSVHLAEQDLRAALKKLIPFVSADRGRPELHGILFEFEHNKLSLFASTGLCVGQQRIDTPEKWKARVTLPTQSCEILMSLLKEERTVELLVSDSFLSVKAETIDFTAKLHVENYPNFAWDRVPKPELSAAFPKDELIHCLELIATTQDPDKGPYCQIKFDTKTTFKSKSSRGEAATSIDTKFTAKFSGQPLEIGVNPLLLIDSIRNIEEPDVTLELTDHLSPIVARAGQFVAVVMPLRIR